MSPRREIPGHDALSPTDDLHTGQALQVLGVADCVLVGKAQHAHADRLVAHAVTSWNVAISTGAPERMDSMAASASLTAINPSWPVARGGVPFS